jgi:hypothetical protein
MHKKLLAARLSRGRRFQEAIGLIRFIARANFLFCVRLCAHCCGVCCTLAVSESFAEIRKGLINLGTPTAAAAADVRFLSAQRADFCCSHYDAALSTLEESPAAGTVFFGGRRRHHSPINYTSAAARDTKLDGLTAGGIGDPPQFAFKVRATRVLRRGR